jgi:hypothetical protein
MESITVVQPCKRTQAETDYRAAWQACAKYLPGEDPADNDLRERLDWLLKSGGWSIEALRDYAFAKWSTGRYAHVTPAVWRWAIYFAKEDLVGEATAFLKEWQAS